MSSAAKHSTTSFETLLVKLGVLKFSSHRDDALKIYGNAKRIINLENDYSFQPESRLKKLQPEWNVWGTVPANVAKHGGAYVNWNVLTWLYPRPWLPALPAYRPAPGRLLYYGAYRADRVDSFKLWLNTDLFDEVVVGARSTHIAKFQALSPALKIVNFKTPDDLAQLRGTAIYLEDDTSHDLYCSLANRFFECLQLGIPMLFDPACHKTLTQARLPQAAQFMPASIDEALYMLKDPEGIARAQRKLWYRDFDAILDSQLARAVARL